jgi:membrane protein
LGIIGRAMVDFCKRLMRALTRVFPPCVTQAQALAFNMFVAFFPVLLFAIGVLNSTAWLIGTDSELLELMRMIIPSGSERLVLDYLGRNGTHPLRLMWLGLGGVLLAGSQVMNVLLEAFRKISGDTEEPSFVHRQLRALLMLVLTMGPSLAVVVLTVFGRQLRTWLILQYGWPNLLREIGVFVYAASMLMLGFAVLILIYWVGRPRQHGWKRLAPGAMLATVLLWAVDISLGTYFRFVPYSVVYGSLAAAIGLLIWMYLSAIVVLLGAAYNMESK